MTWLGFRTWTLTLDIHDNNQGIDMGSTDLSGMRRTNHLGRVTILLSLLALISAILTIALDLNGSETGLYIFKPVSIILILLIAIVSTKPPSIRYRRTIMAGLVFSLAGDVVLVIPQDLFLIGLIFFSLPISAISAPLYRWLDFIDLFGEHCHSCSPG